jgi:hypothetical protein
LKLSVTTKVNQRVPTLRNLVHKKRGQSAERTSGSFRGIVLETVRSIRVVTAMLYFPHLNKRSGGETGHLRAVLSLPGLKDRVSRELTDEPGGYRGVLESAPHLTNLPG